MLYTKRPPEVDAIQFAGNPEEVEDFARTHHIFDRVDVEQGYLYVLVVQQEGDSQDEIMHSGDWLSFDPETGDLSRFSDADFQRQYQPKRE